VAAGHKEPLAAEHSEPPRVITQSLVDAVRQSVAASPEPPPVFEPAPVTPVMSLAEREPAGSAQTVREPALARAAERLAGDPSTTMTLGSPVQSEPSMRVAPQRSVPPPLPEASPLAALPVVSSAAAQATPVLAPSAGDAQKEAEPAAFVDDAHDAFFSAGESAAAHELHEHSAHSFEHEEEAPQVIRRTPEQEARRERNIKYVSLVIGLGLAIPCVALWRSHRQATSPELEASATPVRVAPVAPVAPEPSAVIAEPVPVAPPPTAATTPSAEVIPAPPAMPDITPPVADKPVAPVVADKPAVSRAPAPVLPSEVAPKPKPAGSVAVPAPPEDAAPKPKPAHPAKPGADAAPSAAPVPPSETRKPPTAAFPLRARARGAVHTAQAHAARARRAQTRAGGFCHSHSVEPRARQRARRRGAVAVRDVRGVGLRRCHAARNERKAHQECRSDVHGREARRSRRGWPNSSLRLQLSC